MPWTALRNRLPAPGTDWEKLKETALCASPEDAKRRALRDPEISWFCFCNEGGDVAGRRIAAQETLFFTGPVPEHFDEDARGIVCSRLCTALAYMPSPMQSLEEHFENQPRKVFYDELKLVMAKALKTVSEVRFGDNAALDAVMYPVYLNRKGAALPAGSVWLVPDAPGPTMLRANADFLLLMECGDGVEDLHRRGICFLLSVQNNHDAAGWSHFPPTPEGEADAAQLAQQCAEVLARYHLDGIDIDDENAARGAPACDSAPAMAAAALRAAVPDAVLTKALYVDEAHFAAKHNGSSLAKSLNLGWTVSHWLTPQEQLEPYGGHMVPPRLLCGFQINNYTPARSDIHRMVRDGYGGVMVYGLGNPDYPGSEKILTDLLTFWQGG